MILLDGNVVSEESRVKARQARRLHNLSRLR